MLLLCHDGDGDGGIVVSCEVSSLLLKNALLLLLLLPHVVGNKFLSYGAGPQRPSHVLGGRRA